MEKTTGIKELSELVGFIAEATAIFVVDGKLTDLKNLGGVLAGAFPLVGKIAGAFSGISAIPKELLDLDEAEAREVVALVKVKSGLDSSSGAEKLAEAILDLIPGLVRVVVTVQNLKVAETQKAEGEDGEKA